MSIPGCTHKKHTQKKKKTKLDVKHLNRKLESPHATNSKTTLLTSSSSFVPGDIKISIEGEQPHVSSGDGGRG